MGKFSPTTRNGDCEEIANPSTAYGRRQRNWIEARGPVPTRQVGDAGLGDNAPAMQVSLLKSEVERLSELI
jgi:hypothetical protein